MRKRQDGSPVLRTESYECVRVSVCVCMCLQTQDLTRALEKRGEELSAAKQEAEQAQQEAEDWQCQTRKLNSQVPLTYV